jgi:hypothetical protein
MGIQHAEEDQWAFSMPDFHCFASRNTSLPVITHAVGS